MSKITQTVWALAQPVVERHGCELWDVEYVTEAGTRYLRVYIDKPEGVGIDDCEAVSRELDVLLDEADPIPDSYVFEVSSAGAERELKRPSDFERFMGSNVEVRFFKTTDGRKSVIGTLAGYENGDVSVRVGEETKPYLKAQIAQVRLRIV
jgi:ribosome maturation factor RimP